jgi:hypothetical protein
MGFYSLMHYMKDEYFNKFLHQKTMEWFKYHHAVFIYTLQKILDDIGCYYIFAHNYGQIDGIKAYQLNIDYNKFLSPDSLTSLLMEKNHSWISYPENNSVDSDGPQDYEGFCGKYFQGKQTHPNESGHIRIAELFLEKYHNDNKK